MPMPMPMPMMAPMTPMTLAPLPGMPGMPSMGGGTGAAGGGGSTNSAFTEMIKAQLEATKQQMKRNAEMGIGKTPGTAGAAATTAAGATADDGNKKQKTEDPSLSTEDLVDPKTGKTMSQLAEDFRRSAQPGRHVWTQYKSKEGWEYWHNFETGETTWVKPSYPGCKIDIPKVETAPEPERRPVDPAMIKTAMCKTWDKPSGCRFGNECKWAHGLDDLRAPPERKEEMVYYSADTGGYTTTPKAKTSLCKNFVATGKCPYQNICVFAHGLEELRTKPRDMVEVAMPKSGLPM